MYCSNKFSIILFLALYSVAIDQIHGQHPTISPSIIVPLVAEDDPTQFCYNNLVFDETGRLWMKTCAVAEQLYALQVLQFDGYERWPINVVREEWKELRTGCLEGVSQGGALYGFLNEASERSTLYTYQMGTNTVHYTPLPTGIGGAIREYEAGKYWVLEKTKTAFNIYHWDADSLQPFYSIPNESQFLDEANIFVRGGNSNFIYEDSTFWILDHNLPIIALDQATNHIEHFNGDAFEGSSKSFFWSQPRFIGKVYLKYRDSVLYVAHPRIGKHFYKMNWHGKKRLFTQLKIIPDDARARSIFQDEQGNLLFVYESTTVGQQKTGAYLLDTDNQLFDYSPMIADMPGIRHIGGKDFKRSAYVGTSNGAFFVEAFRNSTIRTYTGMQGLRHIRQIGPDEFLIRIDEGFLILKEGIISRLPIKSCLSKIVGHGGRKELITDSRGEVWLKDDQHLYRYTPNANGSCQSYSFDFKIKVAAFLSDDKVALIAAENNELIIYNLQTKEIIPFSETAIQFQGIIHYLQVGNNNLLWIGTNEGLHKVDLSTGKATHYGETEDFEDHRILVMHEDQMGRLWLGTASRGIHIFDPQKEKVVKVIDETDGLSNNIVVGILEDDEGDIWAATYNGLTLLKPNGEIITVLNEKDGISFHEFNRYAHFKSNDGRLIFGTLNGLNVIDPQQIKAALQASEATKIFLSRLSYYDPSVGQSVNLRNYIPGKAPIVLPADKRYLSFSVGMSNYGFQSKNRFAYQLEGMQEDWTYLGSKHFIRIPNLPVGKYHLVITGIDHNGNRSSNTIRIPIHAREFFYKQAWFYLLCALPFLLFGLLWIRRLRQEKSRLEQEVQKRTVEILKDKELIEVQASELQQLDKMKSRFFANISHDLRTPITLISGPAELLSEEDAVRQDNKLSKAIHSIAQNGKKLLRLVDEIMDLARLESNTIKLHEEAIPVIEFAQAIFDSYLPEAQRKKLNLEFEHQLNKDFELLIDPNRLEKVLNNLLSNALKFTAPGDSITLSIFEQKEQIIFEIADTGRGIPEEDLPHIFDRYFQSKNENLVQTSGSGIGLSLCQEFAKLMEGQLTVESTYGEGSTFRLRLPGKKSGQKSRWQKPQTTSPLPSTVSDQNGSLPPENGARIMVVEDNQEVQDFLRVILETDYKIVTFDDGQAALDFLEASDTIDLPVDFILSDINMPRLDGFGLIEAVKNHQKWQQLPMIMLTARMHERSKLQALRMGVDDYLTKPFSPAELKVRIHNLLENYQNRQAYQQSYLKVNPEFEATLSADQIWLQELEEHSLAALEQQIELNINYLAEKMAIGQRQLARKVKLLTGLTIGRYIHEIKMQKARHLLEHKAYPTVAEIGYVCGFKSPSYFTKKFNEHFGKTPTSYL